MHPHQNNDTNSAMDVIDWCLKELTPPGDDFYYATLYSRKSNPQQVATCGLLKLILQSGLAIEEPTVRLAKLDWWQIQLRQLEQRVSQDSPHALTPNSQHPLITYFRANEGHRLTQPFIALIQQLMATTSIHQPSPTLTTTLGKAIGIALDNQNSEESADCFGYFWLAQFTSKHVSASNEATVYFNAVKNLPVLSNTNHWSLSARCYLALAKLWLKINSSAPTDGVWYEPSAPRKLFTVWKTRLFHR